eukprot:6188184-Pleurochrysis_carterae.AAC.2
MKASLAGANRASSHPPKPPPPPPKSASAAVVQSSSRSASAKTACDAAAAARCQTAPMEAPTQQQQTSPAAVASVRPAAVVPPPRPPRSAGRGGTRPPPPPPPRASSAASSTRCQQQPPAVASVQFHPYGGNPVSECRAVENPVHPLNGNSRALANEPANLLPSASQASAALGCPGPTARVETDQHTFSVSSLHSIVANLEMQMAQASASSNFERCIELRPELRAAKAALLDQSIQQAKAPLIFVSTMYRLAYLLHLRFHPVPTCTSQASHASVDLAVCTRSRPITMRRRRRRPAISRSASACVARSRSYLAASDCDVGGCLKRACPRVAS